MATSSRRSVQQTWLLMALLGLGIVYQVAARKLDISRMSISDIETELQQCPLVRDLNRHRYASNPPASGWASQIFSVLFPSTPAINALLATLYISGPPNFLLALCPPNIDPSSLSVMVAFAVGGLLGDTIFHLLPEIFLGESSPEHARFVLVEPNKNLLLGVAIMVGFVTFVAMDKGLRIATSGVGGHDHSHGTKKEDAEKEEDVGPGGKTTSAEWATRNGDIRSRNISSTGARNTSDEADLPVISSERRKELILLDEPERCKQWIKDVLQKDPESHVTQVVLWRAYESQLKGHGKSLISPTEFIKRVHDVFDDAQLQNINLQTPGGTEKQYIIKGVKSRSLPLATNEDQAKPDHDTLPTASESSSIAPPISTSASTTSSPSIRLSAYLNLIADFTHNITDGLAISSSFYASPTLGATTTVAVFFHEIPHEVGDFALLIQSGFSKSRAMGAQFVTALGAFLGTCLGIMVQELGKRDKSSTSSREISGNSLGLLGTGLGWGDLLLPFTAGTFLYVGTVAVIPDLLETGGDRSAEIRKTTKQFLAMALGAGIMLTISWS